MSLITPHCVFWSAVMVLTLANIHVARRRDISPCRERFIMAIHQWVHGNVFVLAALELSHIDISTYGAFCVIQLLAYPLFCHWQFRKTRGKEKP